jgi:poly-beta-1,6-N-acetyl-D-glucosamine synthase
LKDAPDRSYLIVTPARDESKYIQQTIDSILSQTVTPLRWVIVDDGSSDDTALIAERAAVRCDWIRVVRARDRGTRVVGAGVIQAFNLGLSSCEGMRSAYLCKLDADLVLPHDYFERLINYFESDARLGIACGRIRERIGDGYQTLRYEPEMVFGAAKFYRRKCFEEIGGLAQAIGWDGIDCYQAMRRGWRTATLSDQRLELLHLRRMGTSHKSIFHGCTRRGAGLHYDRSHPLWVLASATYRMKDRPYIVAGLCVLWGYITATVKGVPRIQDPGFGAFLRTWQLNKLKRALVRLFRRAPPVSEPHDA